LAGTLPVLVDLIEHFKDAFKAFKRNSLKGRLPCFYHFGKVGFAQGNFLLAPVRLFDN
jgi:hypothetical protein